MTLEGNDWILLTSKSAIMADRLREQLKRELGVESLPGLPIDWRSSLESDQIKIIPSSGKLNSPVGVFVSAKDFDNLVTNKLISGT